MKEHYITHLWQDLGYKKYARPDDIARAIGGSFTPEIVIGIANDCQGEVHLKKASCAVYIDMETFLPFFECGLEMCNR